MKTIHDNPVSSREMVRMIILFVFGSSVVMGVNPRTMQDAWICLLIAAAISVPVFFIYARIMHLMDGKDFFTCVLDWFGGIPGRIVIALLVWYYLYLAAVVVRNFSEFMEIVAMPETPQIPMMISFLLVSAYLCKSRIQVISQWSIVGLCITVGIMIITVLSTVASMRPQNLLPILEHSPPVMMKSTFEIFAFPFAECVVFLPLISAAKHGSPYKVFFKGLFYSTLVLMVIILRNVLTLGPQLMEAEYFPSYSCARIMEIGSFLSRIEGTISINFIVSGLTKTSLCLYSGALGLAKLLNVPNKLDLIIMPIFLFVLMLCALSYTDAVQMFNFLDFYPFYALPFQVIVPVVIWLVGEWKAHSKKTSSVQTASQPS